jgi:ABC-type lipoprotein export system ATPase subunit
LWSLENPKSRNVIIMDEPFRFSGRLITKAVTMVKELSDKLGIQFIINTHSDELIDIADRSWQVLNIKGQSIVEQT